MDGEKTSNQNLTVLKYKRICLWLRDKKLLKQRRKHARKNKTEKLDYTKVKNPYIKLYRQAID